MSRRQSPDAFTRRAADWPSSGAPCDFGRLLAEFDDPGMKNLLVSLDESCATKAIGRPRALAGRFARNVSPPAATKASAGSRLAAARENAGDAEQLLAQFCEQSKSKHLSDYERRKK